MSSNGLIPNPLIRRVRSHCRPPDGWGIVYYDGCWDELVVAPIPLNFPIKWLYLLWLYCLCGGSLRLVKKKPLTIEWMDDHDT